MKARILLVCILVAMPVFAPAASKEIQELQRDIALLQQQVKDLQRSQDEKFAQVTELARQAIEAANRANTGAAVIQSSLDKSIQNTQSAIGGPLAATSTRMKEISDNVTTLTQAVSDLTAMLNRMQTQLTDINQTVKTIQAPPVAPPPQQTGGQPDGSGAASNTPCPTTPAAVFYDTARRDYQSGKYDLAISEFNDYLRCFGNTELAPNAQFYIAMTHFGQRNYEQALREFDIVLEKYSDNNKTPEALLYKGRSLANIPGRKTAATDEWKELIRRFPRSNEAKLACDDLKSFGMNCPTPR